MEVFIFLSIVLASLVFWWESSKKSRDGEEVIDLSLFTRGDAASGTALDDAPSSVSWVPVSEAITVAGRTIRGGQIYTGRTGRHHLSTTFDPSLIDPDLLVKNRSADTSVASIGYWPSYRASIQPLVVFILTGSREDGRNPISTLDTSSCFSMDSNVDFW
jgi:hypothetical protein